VAEAKQYVLPMPRRRGVIFFLLANAFAFALCGCIWALFWYGDFFTPAARAIWGFLARNSGWTVGAALSPLFAALVLGYTVVLTWLFLWSTAAVHASAIAAAGSAAPVT